MIIRVIVPRVNSDIDPLSIRLSSGLSEKRSGPSIVSRGRCDAAALTALRTPARRLSGRAGNHRHAGGSADVRHSSMRCVVRETISVGQHTRSSTRPQERQVTCWRAAARFGARPATSPSPSTATTSSTWWRTASRRSGAEGSVPPRGPEATAIAGLTHARDAPRPDAPSPCTTTPRSPRTSRARRCSPSSAPSRTRGRSPSSRRS
jgi:hypothetical protein